MDTDAASLLQRGRLPIASVQLLNGNRLAVTFVTVGEFYKGAYMGGWGQKRMEELERWLRGVGVVPYDAAVAKEWGRVTAEGKAKGREIQANDAWIAACCRLHALPLMTFNQRHFRDVSGLVLV